MVVDKPKQRKIAAAVTLFDPQTQPTTQDGIKIHCAYKAIIPMAEIAKRLNPGNVNEHPEEQVAELVEQFKYQGVRHPIIISTRDGVMSAGEGRYLAALRLGMQAFPVDWQEFDSFDQQFAFGVADNAVAAMATLNRSKINAMIPKLDGLTFQIPRLGIPDFQVDVADKFEGKDADAVPEVLPKAFVRPGDLFILGSHRLLCGDSTQAEQVARLMNGEKADMVFTDPPYGVSYDDTQHSHQKGFKASRFGMIHGDDKEFTFPSLEPEEQFWFGANYYCQQLPKGGSWFVWDKKTEAMQENGMLFTNDFELCWSKTKHKSVMVRKVWAGAVNKEKGESRLHPTQKPVALCEYFIKEFGRSVVFDPFLGSGSTLIACEKTNRKCMGLEIDPVYCGVILDRWAKFTGKDPVREDGTAWSIIKGGA